MNLRYYLRLSALLLSLTVAVESCDMMLVPNQGTDTSGSTVNTTDDTGMQEIADNPATSQYYDEPFISYGAPGDGLAANGSQGDTHLASFQLGSNSSGQQAPEQQALVAGAVKKAGQLLMQRPGIVGTGEAHATDGSAHVMVFAATNSDAAKVPASIDGIATEVKVTGRIRALSGYQGTYRPVVPCGVSVGNSRENSSGTIGAIVVRNGIRYILSNNHVLARENSAVIGEPIVQPGRADNYGRATGQIGVLSAYKMVSFYQDNTFDAAVARLTTTNSFDEADQFQPSRNPVTAQPGMAVMKVGRTTGITYGTIEATDVTVKVDYDGGTATFVNQIYIPGSFLQAGDSGSLLVTQDGGHPVGLCFAGGDDGAFANPIAPILSYFGVRIAGTNN